VNNKKNKEKHPTRSGVFKSLIASVHEKTPPLATWYKIIIS